MEGNHSKNKFFLVLALLNMAATLVKGQGTRVGFYSTSCPLVESIVSSTVQSHLQSDPSLGPAILRMHFHDWFKTAPPNLGVRGYEVIDDAKAQVEATCPGVVSCADILALAARDAVFLLVQITGFEPGISIKCSYIVQIHHARNQGCILLWNPFSFASSRSLRRSTLMLDVPTGRRDGKVSLASDADNLPAFTDSIEELKRKFSAFGLNARDLVTLVGAHTIGTTACEFFSYRLFNFSATSNGADPSINPDFVSQLRTLCPSNGDGTRRVALDTDSVDSFDASFFHNLRKGRGILASDLMLWTDGCTRSIVESYLGVRGLPSLKFNVQFGKSMVKMSNIEVKKGTNGEIRKICSAINEV
ncbi:hypothetical protein ES288_D02G242000v1 [Gossypium darwinii]|uniref:Peroxidase n=1 Tax=Gossypium darwinii TaxID=34276 RepID=A0A5D2DJK5_GOSDA|nr:hypothetical protein ES288_D02G242000v1 [Gossypium darwinii]